MKIANIDPPVAALMFFMGLVASVFLGGCYAPRKSPVPVVESDYISVCVSCIPKGCRAVVTPDGKVTYEKELNK